VVQSIKGQSVTLALKDLIAVSDGVHYQMHMDTKRHRVPADEPVKLTAPGSNVLTMLARQLGTNELSGEQSQALSAITKRDLSLYAIQCTLHGPINLLVMDCIINGGSGICAMRADV
jgi:hypothetical protein